MIKFLAIVFLLMILTGASLTVLTNGMIGFIGLCVFLLGMLSMLLLVHYDFEKNNL